MIGRPDVGLGRNFRRDDASLRSYLMQIDRAYDS